MAACVWYRCSMRFLYIHMHSIAKCTHSSSGVLMSVHWKFRCESERVRFSKFEKLCDILQGESRSTFSAFSFQFSVFLFYFCIYFFFFSICCSSKSIRYAISCIMIAATTSGTPSLWCQWVSDWLLADTVDEPNWAGKHSLAVHWMRWVSEFVAIHECKLFGSIQRNV